MYRKHNIDFTNSGGAEYIESFFKAVDAYGSSSSLSPLLNTEGNVIMNYDIQVFREARDGDIVTKLTTGDEIKEEETAGCSLNNSPISHVYISYAILLFN